VWSSMKGMGGGVAARIVGCCIGTADARQAASCNQVDANVRDLARAQRSVVHGRMPRCARALFLLLTACAVVHEEPAVRGLPIDDWRAPLSAVWVGHATVLLRIGRRNVIADPNLGGSIV